MDFRHLSGVALDLECFAGGRSDGQNGAPGEAPFDQEIAVNTASYYSPTNAISGPATDVEPRS